MATPTPIEAALAELCKLRSYCPSDSAAAREHHRRVKVDASTGAPVTDHGKRLLETSRAWPAEACRIGECLCGSSLMFTLLDDQEVALRPAVVKAG